MNKKMKLFVDDIREPPNKGWLTARSAEVAIEILNESNVIDTISLDHDLGTGATGYNVLCWIERKCRENPYYRPPEVIIIHTNNPVGKTKMKAVKQRLKNWER